MPYEYTMADYGLQPLFARSPSQIFGALRQEAGLLGIRERQAVRRWAENTLLPGCKTLAEQSALRFILERTLGFGKLREYIMVRHFLEGIDGIIGALSVSRRTLIRALDALERRGLVCRYRLSHRHGYVYGIATHDWCQGGTSNPDQRCHGGTTRKGEDNPKETKKQTAAPAAVPGVLSGVLNFPDQFLVDPHYSGRGTGMTFTYASTPVDTWTHDPYPGLPSEPPPRMETPTLPILSEPKKGRTASPAYAPENLDAAVASALAENRQRNATRHSERQARAATSRLTAAELSRHWVDQMREAYPNDVVASLGPRERGQLRQLVDGVHGVSPTDVVETVIQNWVPFCRSKLGWMDLPPDRPAIGLLLNQRVAVAEFITRRGTASGNRGRVSRDGSSQSRAMVPAPDLTSQAPTPRAPAPRPSAPQAPTPAYRVTGAPQARRTRPAARPIRTDHGFPDFDSLDAAGA